MNVAITTIADDIGTTVIGLQTAITLFTLTMAALMIPGSKLTDIWGRKRCFMLGLIIYGSGALIASTAGGLPVLIGGGSLIGGGCPGRPGSPHLTLVPPVFPAGPAPSPA